MCVLIWLTASGRMRKDDGKRKMLRPSDKKSSRNKV